MASNKPLRRLRQAYNRPTSEQQVEETLSCTLCMNTVVSPMKPLCANGCKYVICKSHILQLHKCLLCRSYLTWADDEETNRLISAMTQKCKCGKYIALSEVEEHQKLCPWGVQSCPVCNEAFSNQDMIKHLHERHYFNILFNFHRCVRSDKPAR